MRITLVPAVLVAFSALAADVTTANYNLNRDNNQPGESVLTASNISTLHRKATYSVNGFVYAQPLVYAGRLYAVTNSDYVYAFQANPVVTTPIWSASVGTPASVDPVAQGRPDGLLGCIGTPVVNTALQVIYALCLNGSAWQLNSLNLADGSQYKSPVTISGTSNGVTFTSTREQCRTSLALANNVIYFGCSMVTEETTGGAGFVFAYDATTLAQKAVLCLVSAANGGAGVWMAGAAPAINAAGEVCVLSGNGTWDGTSNFGESILRLSGTSLAVIDYMTPSNWSTLNGNDQDFGSGRCMIIDTHFLGIGKDARLWLVSQSNLGQLQNAASPTITQTWATGFDEVFAGTAFANSNLYLSSINGFHIKRFAYSGGLFTTASAATTTASFGFTALAYSSNSDAAGTGILWAVTSQSSDNTITTASTLRAFDPSSLTELWNSNSEGNDNSGYTANYASPTVANGYVYIGTFSNQVIAYGINTTPASTQTISGNVSFGGSTRP